MYIVHNIGSGNQWTTFTIMTHLHSMELMMKVWHHKKMIANQIYEVATRRMAWLASPLPHKHMWND
jgi:hypothetical protein